MESSEKQSSVPVVFDKPITREITEGLSGSGHRRPHFGTLWFGGWHSRRHILKQNPQTPLGCRGSGGSAVRVRAKMLQDTHNRDGQVRQSQTKWSLCALHIKIEFFLPRWSGAPDPPWPLPDPSQTPPRPFPDLGSDFSQNGFEVGFQIRRGENPEEFLGEFRSEFQVNSG